MTISTNRKFQRLRQTATVFAFCAALVFSLSIFQTAARAQNGDSFEPGVDRDELLNGLKIIYAPRPAENQVVIKLRVAGGAKFDLAGKEGSMALLGDALFPEAATRQTFKEEFGGRLDVSTNYDWLDATLTGRPDAFTQLLELLRSAVINQLPSQEIVARLAQERAKMLQEKYAQPAALADRAAALRFYGAYPLGRPVDGTSESVSKLTRADLLTTRERLFNPNNSVLVLAGAFDERFARRAVRQFFGIWRKSETEIPATFRQPDAPDARPLIVDFPGAQSTEFRLAAKGLAREDRDSLAAETLARVALERWRKEFPQARSLNVRHISSNIGGLFLMSADAPPTAGEDARETAQKVLRGLITTPPTNEELNAARSFLRDVISAQPPLEREADALVRKAFGATTVNELRALDALTTADLQRAASRIVKDPPVATVAVGDAAALRNQLARGGEVVVTDKTLTIAPAKTAAPSTKEASDTNSRRPQKVPFKLPTLKPIPQP